MPAAKAPSEPGEVSTGQSIVSGFSNHISPWIRGNSVASDSNICRIHSGFEPPTSEEAVSPTSIGFVGAIVSVIWR
jgi:hypothetical protein